MMATLAFNELTENFIFCAVYQINPFHASPFSITTENIKRSGPLVFSGGLEKDQGMKLFKTSFSVLINNKLNRFTIRSRNMPKLFEKKPAGGWLHVKQLLC